MRFGAPTIPRRSLLIAWDVAVLAALGSYVAQFSRLDPASTLFPRLIGYPVLGLTLLSLLVQTLPFGGRLRGDVASGDPVNLPRFALGLLVALVYFALWFPLGFELDTVLFVGLAPLLLGQRRRSLAISFPVGIAIALLFVFLFRLGGGTVLPKGFLHVGWP